MRTFWTGVPLLVLQCSTLTQSTGSQSVPQLPVVTNGESSRHLRTRYYSTSILCRMTMFDTMYVSSQNVSTTTKETMCIPIVDGVETDLDFTVDLPSDLIKEHAAAIEMGQLLVNISDTALVGQKLVIGRNPTFAIVTDPQLRHLQERHLQTNGIMTLSMIRISTLDAAPTATAKDLERALSATSVNFASQYEACSFGQMKWELAGPVIEVALPNRVSDFASSADLVTAAQKQLKAQNGGREVSKLANKVMMCVPPGTGDWAASAGVNHWRAQFNNDWCTSLSGTVHELGHTLGLLHSNADGVDYADRSGYMGSGYTDTAWPRKCFNGYNSWRFGWYSTRHLSLNPLVDGNRLVSLATFVDYSLATVDESVLVNIVDQYYLQYNKAKGFNIDTEHKVDQVTITQPTKTGSNSLAGLSAGTRYTVTNFHGSGRTLILEACQSKVGAGGSDVMEISAALDTSLCGGAVVVPNVATVPRPTPSIPQPSVPTVLLTPVPAAGPTSTPSSNTSTSLSTKPTSTGTPFNILVWLGTVLARLRKKSRFS